jgi:ABC-type amino acid transport substrate-binding protein
MESDTSSCPKNRGVSTSLLCLVVLITRTPAAPISPQDAKAAASLAIQSAPWTGDFEGMLQRGYIRALVAYSKTQYYVVNGVQHGSSYEYMKAFEAWVNHEYQRKTKHTLFHVVCVPVSRDQMFPRLAVGRGDLAVGNLEITLERSRAVDFSDPLATGVRRSR